MRNLHNNNYYYYKSILLSIIIASVRVDLVNCQGMPMSPCPKMFQYRFDGTEWFGLVAIRNPDENQALHLRVMLVMRGKPATNYLGEIELLTRGQISKDMPILYKIKFPKHHFPPKLFQIAANNHVVCFGPVEHGIFITQIQLEHTRKFGFVPEPSKDFGFETSAPAAAPSFFPPMNDAFGNKHLPFASLKTRPPINTHQTSVKDICGTIDESIYLKIVKQLQPQELLTPTSLLTLLLPKREVGMARNFHHVSEKPSIPTFATSSEDGSELMDINYYDDVDNDAGDHSSNDEQEEVDDDIVGANPMPPPLSLPQLPTITRGYWPWLAAIYVNNLTSLSYQCGGTLISSRIVLSVAHCFQMFRQRYTANEVLVFLGRHDLKDWNEEGSVAAPVDDIFTHSDYDTHLNSYDADIAVVILKNEVQFNTYIRPACMWSGSTKNEFIEGAHGVVVAWNLGKHFNTTAFSATSTSFAASSSQLSNDTNPKAHSIFATKFPRLQLPLTIPRIIDAPIVSNEACFQADDKFRSLSSNRTFCAGVVYPSADALLRQRKTSGPCTGDSGAGLLIFKNTRWYLRGIVSATLPAINSGSSAPKSGRNTCNVNQFVLYTDVAKFLDWIFAFII